MAYVYTGTSMECSWHGNWQDDYPALFKLGSFFPVSSPISSASAEKSSYGNCPFERGEIDA